VLEVIRRYWGFDALRPLQEQAIHAGLDGRDSLVVLPTGGGKSLCYQAPAAIAERTDLVVSPLISLMKDQVDALRACGYPAAALHSNMSVDERRAVEAAAVRGEFRLLFVSPERLALDGFLAGLRRMNLRAVAIDEAHCISHWGHDFRPDYRTLSTLRTRLPGVSLHAYTATATPRVREDIVAQLALRDPLVLVGTFDRPNLTYRVVPRADTHRQALEVVGRHRGQAVIAYCITRRETEELALSLASAGVRAAHYHAGMSAADRAMTQDAFASERLDVVVATVAFGMGIDRSDVRCVLHTAMPKSIEHYQQETGRAGRDGLEAECVLLYSGADGIRWESLMARETGEASESDAALLRDMQRYCVRTECRHRQLSEYFGQRLDSDGCGACDVCLGEIEGVFDGTVTAQKILSCVARVEERFGATHVVNVLRGAENETVRRHGHARLSTFGLLRDMPQKEVSNYVYQLIDQGLLVRAAGEFPTLGLNAESWSVMRGQSRVFLREITARQTQVARSESDAWAGVDRDLFETLRRLRRQFAEDRGVPPFVIFNDATLRDMARRRPGSLRALRAVSGIGERKLRDFGAAFVEKIVASGRAAPESATADAGDDGGEASDERGHGARRRSQSSRYAARLFADGATIEDVMDAMGRARSTALRYLLDHIACERPASIARWVDEETYARVEEAAQALGTRFLGPIREHLGGEIDYDLIRLVLAHSAARSQPAGGAAE